MTGLLSVQGDRAPGERGGSLATLPPSPSIQVRCGSSWSTVYGTSGGNTQEFILQPGEYITMISGSYKLYMHSLVIYTHMGRYGLFGKESDFSFMAYPDEEGQVLTGICGQHKLLGISGLCFNWSYPPTNITEVYAFP